MIGLVAAWIAEVMTLLTVGRSPNSTSRTMLATIMSSCWLLLTLVLEAFDLLLLRVDDFWFGLLLALLLSNSEVVLFINSSTVSWTLFLTSSYKLVSSCL